MSCFGALEVGRGPLSELLEQGQQLLALRGERLSRLTKPPSFHYTPPDVYPRSILFATVMH